MQTRSNQGRSFGAIVLIALGALFLLANLGVFSFSIIGVMWPFFIILPGLVFFFFAATGSAELSSLAIPGSIVTGTGAILLFQSITGRWESWAYIWTLYPVFLGLGLMYMGRRMGKSGSYKTGRGFVTAGLIGFLAFGSFFEVLVFGGFSIGRYILPAALILIGFYMLRGGRRHKDLDEVVMPRKREVFENGEPFPSPPPMPRKAYAPTASDRLRKAIDEALEEDEDLVEESMEPDWTDDPDDPDDPFDPGL